MSRHYYVRCAAGLLLFATACPARGPHASAPTPQPVRGGTLRALFASDPGTLDPNGAASPSSWFFARAIHRGLLAFPDTAFPGGAQPVPDLAEAMPVVSGATYTFRLRADVRFGAPASRVVRASDVVASIARVRASRTPVATVLGALASVDAKDARTVVFTLARPRTDFLWALAQPQAAIVPEQTAAPGRALPESIAGAGPYRIASYSPERSVTLVRNTAWSDDNVRKAYVDRIEATFGVAPASANRSVAQGSAEIVVDPGPPDEQVAVPPGASTVRAGSGCVRYLFVDPRAAPFESVYARRAVAEAVVRAGLGGGAAASGILPSQVFGSDNARLEENADGAHRDLVRAKLPGGFTTTIRIEDTARDRAQASALARTLVKAGITVKISTGAPADVVSEYADRTRVVPMGLATWCADWPGNAGWDVLNGVSARAPALADALMRATTATDTKGAWAAADRTVCAYAAVVPLLWTAETTVVSTTLHGFTGAPMWPRGDPTGLWIA